MIKFDKKIFLGLPLALISIQVFLGVLLGYFFGKIISGKKTGEPGKIKSIILKMGHYKLHLHHWLLSTGILILNFLAGIFLPFPKFSLSFLGGLAIQGILCYSDWHQIIKK